MLRVATVVEGVCVTLDEEFDFIGVATDYLREEGYLAEGVRYFVEDRAIEVSDAARSAVRIPPKLESALDRVEREDFRVQADIEDSDGLLATMTKRSSSGCCSRARCFRQRSCTRRRRCRPWCRKRGESACHCSVVWFSSDGFISRLKPWVFSLYFVRDGRARAGSTPPSARTPTTPTAVTERRVRLLGQSRFRSGRVRTRPVLTGLPPVSLSR